MYLSGAIDYYFSSWFSFSLSASYEILYRMKLFSK